MTPINKKKLLTGIAACVVVTGIVAFANNANFINDLLAPPTQTAAATAPLQKNLPQKPATSEVSAKPAVPSKININTASADQLMTLHGIGQSKADAIIAYRTTHGLFYQPSDITKVKGIGPAMLAAMQDKITVGNVTPPIVSPDRSSAHTVTTGHVVITSLMVGDVHASTNEYIELYNASSDTIDLSGWSVKKKSSSGSISTLVSPTHFSGIIIPSSKYLLLASSGYTGSVSADITWPASYSFSQKNNALMLYDKSGTLIDTVSWSAIPPGNSYVRVSPDGSAFVVGTSTLHNSVN